MIYEAFCMRIHGENDGESAATWTLNVGDDALEHFLIGDVSNPMATPKTAYEDIPGRNGVYDATENSGRVLYNRKNVTVVLQGEASYSGMAATENALRLYQGRVVDFAFAEPDSVEWYYTGRLTVDSNRFRNRITLTLDTEPLMTSTNYVVKTIPVVARMDRMSFGWTVEHVLYGAMLTSNAMSFAETVVVGVSHPGTVIDYVRTVNPGEVFTLGVFSMVGGDVEFYNVTDRIWHSKTIGVADENGKLTMRVTVDGSFYDWMTITSAGEEVDEYIPAFQLKYRLAKLPMTNGELDEEVFVELPTNVMIYPEIAKEGIDVQFLLDGAFMRLGDIDGAISDTPEAILPGYRADFSGRTTKSVFVAVPETTLDSGTNHVLMSFKEKAVG